MNIKDIRRANLRKWVASHGVPQKEKSYFSQLTGEGDVSFGERSARRLERDYKMGDGYLDSGDAGQKDVPQGAPIESVLGHGLQWINSEEYKLLTLYRGTDDEGRDKIMRTADVVPKILLAGLTYHKA